MLKQSTHLSSCDTGWITVHQISSTTGQALWKEEAPGHLRVTYGSCCTALGPLTGTKSHSLLHLLKNILLYRVIINVKAILLNSLQAALNSTFFLGELGLHQHARSQPEATGSVSLLGLLTSFKQALVLSL